jgi:hypothetical protein
LTLFIKAFGRDGLSSVRVSSSNSVQEVKAKLGLRDDCNLIFGTQHLNDAHSLNQYAIEDGSVIEVWPSFLRDDETFASRPTKKWPSLGLNSAPIPRLGLGILCPFESPLPPPPVACVCEEPSKESLCLPSDFDELSPRSTDRSQLVSSYLSQSSLMRLRISKCRPSNDGDTPS